MNQKTTKRALLASVMSLMLSLAMLIGATFAWFTDTASTAVNKIQSGTLKLSLQYAKEYNDDGTVKTWDDAEGGTLNFLRTDGTKLVADANILWEPGARYKLPQLKISNEGSLALKYKVVISGATGDTDLLSQIDFTSKVNDGAATTFTDGETLVDGKQLLPKEGTKVSSDTIDIEGTMKTTADNKYQNKTITGIAITVVATQATHENDSMSDQYDKDAAYPKIITVDASTAGENATGSGDTDSKNAFEDAMTADDENIVINLSGDAVYDLNGYTLPIGGENTKSITINGNGNKVIFNKLNTNLSTVMCNGVKLTIKNATVAVGTDRAGSSTWDAHDIVFKGDVAFENVIFDRAVAIEGDASFKNCTISDKNVSAEAYMLWIVSGSNVSLDNCIIDGTSNIHGGNRAIAIKDQYREDNPGMTTLTINGGKISGDKKAAVIVSSLGGANITVTGTVDISGVAKDSTNLVWIDNGKNSKGVLYTTAKDKVKVSGATAIVEP